MRIVRFIASLVVGCGVVVALSAVAFSALRALWPEYVAAEPDKAFTLGMLFARLGIAAVLTIAAACAATLVAGDRGVAAACLGALFLVVSLPAHLDYVWDDYPAWYHFVYLVSLVPLAYGSARALRSVVPAAAFGDGRDAPHRRMTDASGTRA